MANVEIRDAYVGERQKQICHVYIDSLKTPS